MEVKATNYFVEIDFCGFGKESLHESCSSRVSLTIKMIGNCAINLIKADWLCERERVLPTI